MLFRHLRERETPVAGGGRTRGDRRVVRIFSFQGGSDLCLSLGRERSLLGRFVVVVGLEERVEDQQVGRGSVDDGGDLCTGT